MAVNTTEDLIEKVNLLLWGKLYEKCEVPNNLTIVCLRYNDDQSNKPSISQINLLAHLNYNPGIRKYKTPSPIVEQISANLTPKLHGKDDSECYEMPVFPDTCFFS